MIVRVIDLPADGRDFLFDLDVARVNTRASLIQETDSEDALLTPRYEFVEPPQVKVHVEKEGVTVMVKGHAHGKAKTQCSRCGEDTIVSIETPIIMFLKPSEEKGKKDEQIEDVEFGFYDGKDVDCSEIAEELIMLSLPYSVVCKEDCKGLCSQCGVNRNITACKCEKKEAGDPRLAILRQIKIQ